MAQLLIDSATRRYDIRTAVELAPQSAEVGSLFKFVEEVHASVPVGIISLTRIEDVYKYVIETVDGRVWQQLIKFDGKAPRFTFDTPSFWKLEEFASQRNLRDLLVQLVSDFGLHFISILLNDIKK